MVQRRLVTTLGVERQGEAAMDPGLTHLVAQLPVQGEGLHQVRMTGLARVGHDLGIAQVLMGAGLAGLVAARVLLGVRPGGAGCRLGHELSPEAGGV